jgi:hypothetical protein
MIEVWRQEENGERPQGALGYLTPNGRPRLCNTISPAPRDNAALLGATRRTPL